MLKFLKKRTLKRKNFKESININFISMIFLAKTNSLAERRSLVNFNHFGFRLWRTATHIAVFKKIIFLIYQNPAKLVLQCFFEKQTNCPLRLKVLLIDYTSQLFVYAIIFLHVKWIGFRMYKFLLILWIKKMLIIFCVRDQKRAGRRRDWNLSSKRSWPLLLI